MKTRFFFLFILAVLFTYGSPLDDDPLKVLLSKLERFRTKFPQEKVHLQLDKPYYTIGDSIWFKAYVVNSEKNKPSDLGRILYVELINDKDSIKQSLRLPLVSGLGWGDFTLSDSLREGNYRIRAYTNWMRNFSDEYFFDKTIRIGNALSNNIVTDAKYTFSKQGNNENVLANVTYTELDGKPVARKEVTYNIQLNFRNIASGKGITDENGNLKIRFVNNQPFILKSGKITTSLKLEDKVFITNIIPVKSTSNEVNVQFFPESGQLVNSIRSKVAFKAVKSDGLGIDVSGYVTDKDNNKVAEFKAEHAGMGAFALTPLTGNSYKAFVKFSDGSEKSFDLPKAVQNGYVLTVDTANNDNIKIRILTSADIYNKGGEVILIAQANNVIQYVAKTKLENSVLSTSLSRKRFPTGVLQFTLFAPDNQPVAERLVFIQHNDQLKISVSTNNPSYKKREKVQLTFNVTDAEGKPVQGNFSLAVTEESKMPYDDMYETTIFSNLLLTSDLRGYIEAPDYYFTDINPQDSPRDSPRDSANANANANENKAQQLDNLMLTQGWRRFTWKNLQSEVYPVLSFMPEQSIEISGRVIANNGTPVVGGKVTLFTSSGKSMGLDTLTDIQGLFRFNNLLFIDSTKFVIHALNEKGRNNVEIELNYTRPPLVTLNKYANDIEVNVNQSLLSYLKNRQKEFDEMRRNGMLKKSILLAEVKVIEKKAAVINSSNLNGAGNADVIIQGSILISCLNLAQCLEGKIPGVTIQNGIPYLTRNLGYGGGPMHLIEDGINIDFREFASINPNIVESIEVLKNISTTAIYGFMGGNGVLIINTKRGQFKPNGSAHGIASYAQQGYYIGRQFYSPDYDDPKTIKQMADLRTTIYWNPTIVTDTTGKAKIEFFNSDGIGNYKAVIEGLNANGKLGRQVFRYTVQ